MTASPSADRVRDEAERLVAAAITVISSATRGFGAQPGSGFATGSPECCVCPVCRAIAALRDPSPDLADKLAAGVGDLAAGVASILRTLSQRGPAPDDDDPADPPRSEGDEWWDSLRRRAADAAKAAARGGAADEDDPWHVATNGATDGRATSDGAAVSDEAPVLTTGPGAVRKTVAKKAVAKKAVAKKAVAKKADAAKPAGVAE